MLEKAIARNDLAFSCASESILNFSALQSVAGPIKLFLASRLSGSEIMRARKPFRALVICNRTEGKICTEGRKDDNGSGGEFPSR